MLTNIHIHTNKKNTLKIYAYIRTDKKQHTKVNIHTNKKYTHANIHTYTSKHTHTNIYIQTYAYKHIHNKNMHTDIYAYNHTRTNNFIQTYNTLTKNKHIKIRTKKHSFKQDLTI